MLSSTAGVDRRHLGRSLFTSLVLSTQVIDDVASKMFLEESLWIRNPLGHCFSISRQSTQGRGEENIAGVFKQWLRTHEEAQVMLASILVVIGIWWLVKAVLTLVISLICPLMVVILAVVCVPQLREPLLGQNYPVMANLLRNILLKMADNVKP